MRKKLFYISFLLLSNILIAQQDPEFTNYMYNMNVINPAYSTGTPGTINLGSFYRSQWVGAVGAPKTFSFFGHLPINEKIETGLSLISDDIGDGALKENNIYADFAYNLKLSKKHTLAFGLKTGVTFLNTNFNNFRLESGSVTSDPAFRQNLNKTYPNIGSGVFFYTDNYYLGFSTPNFLWSKHLDEVDGVQRVGGEEIHFYLTGGYVFNLNSDFQLKPSFMVRSVKGVPPMFDISTNVRYLNRFELGLSYRIDDSVSALMNVGVTQNLRIGYAYDYTTTNFGNYNSGSHEIFILFDLTFNNGYDKSPRFF